MRISDWSSDVCSSDLDVAVLARGATLQAIRTNGLVLRGDVERTIPMEASDDAARLDLRDLVIFAVKAPALASAASAARPMIGADTLIVPMLNGVPWWFLRSEEHTSELQSLMRISYAVFCLKKKN